MDETIKKAEELLEERSKQRRANGHPVETAPEADETAAAAEKSRSDTEALRRLAADFANYRKRNEAERTDFAKYAKADVIRKLLDVLDGYDRALETVPAELDSQPWVEGMRLVERKLRSVLEGEGLQAVESIGQPFDPYVHEAAAHLESDRPEGTVIQEFQKAYRLHDRIIRPALVAVAKGKEE